MSDAISIGRRADEVTVSPQFSEYSKVIIHIDDETAIESGDDSGRVLEIDNPFGTQTMADNILASLSGFEYQPYEAGGALLDPAAEIGDAVNIRGTYGGIYKRDRTFTRLMKADISAPREEEINHEYKFESQKDRQYKRQLGDIRASLIIANDKIEAKVSKTSPEGQTSFSWAMNDTSHRWYANGAEVMAITSTGLTVTGEVTATSGKIGGFNIGSSAIWNGISSFGGSGSSGVYVGTNGIQLGQNFRVSAAGALTLRGTITFQNSDGTSAGTLSAANLRAGANAGYNWANGSYGGYNSRSDYALAGSGNGFTAKTTWDNAQNANIGIGYIKAGTINAAGTFILNESVGSWRWVDDLGFAVLATSGIG